MIEWDVSGEKGEIERGESTEYGIEGEERGERRDLLNENFMRIFGEFHIVCSPGILIWRIALTRIFYTIFM